MKAPSALPAQVVGAGSIITVAFMGSVVVSPLYSLYQAEFGFSDITLTLVYAVYAVGNVVALLAFGQISDQVGRKRAALPGLGLALAAGLVFLFAQGTAWLFVGRLLIGLAVGICSGTGTAWIAEQLGAERRDAATMAAATANLTGIAVGPLIGGLLAQYAPSPLHLPLVVYVGLVAASAAAVMVTRETRRPQVASLREVRVHPRVGVPRPLVPAFAAPGITGFVTFSLGGLYFALIPSIVIRDLHQTNVAVGGAIICEVAALAIVLIWLGSRLRPITAMRIGLISLLPAVVLVVLAQWQASMVLLLVAAALGGVVLAIGYRGSLSIVNQIAPDDQRAELVSTYFICCFVGNSVPVIGIGIVSTHTSPLTASICFAVLEVVLAAVALLWPYREANN